MGNRLIGYGSYLPSRVMTNQDFERIMDTTDEWITTRTGIRERRFARDDESVVDMATIAATRALENANLTIDDIDLVIDVGDLGKAKPSTVIDLSSSKPTLVRNGFDSNDMDSLKEDLEKLV